MAKPIYFFVQDITDSELVMLGDTNEGSVECRDTFDLYVYDLSRFNGDMAETDYMIVEDATERDLEDSPANPYAPGFNDFYRGYTNGKPNSELFVDSSMFHSVREMCEIYKDLMDGGIPKEEIKAEHVREVLAEAKKSFTI